MFAKLSLLITVALGLLASASPITKETGIRVPLSKRGSLKKADGTFDYDLYAQHLVKLQS